MKSNCKRSLTTHDLDLLNHQTILSLLVRRPPPFGELPTQHFFFFGNVGVAAAEKERSVVVVVAEFVRTTVRSARAAVVVSLIIVFFVFPFLCGGGCLGNVV